MGKKNIWDVLKELNQGDIDNHTAHVEAGSNFVSGRMTKRGDEITMGAGPGTLEKLSNETHFVVLLVVDREAFRKAKEGETDGI